MGETVYDRLVCAASMCCDVELQALLLDAAALVPTDRPLTPRRDGPCSRCGQTIAEIGDGCARGGMCIRCYGAERHLRRKALRCSAEAGREWMG